MDFEKIEIKKLFKSLDLDKNLVKQNKNLKIKLESSIIDKNRKRLFNYKSYKNYLKKNPKLIKKEYSAATKSLKLCNKLIENYINKDNISSPKKNYITITLIETLYNLIDMFEHKNNVKHVNLANKNMREFIEISYKYCKNRPDNCKNIRMGNSWYNRYKKYNPAPHGNIRDLNFSIEDMINDIEFCIKKLKSNGYNLIC
ncbi:hypothetical protein [Paraclostridium bifermentans]|uniref:hypothetical protein n=1 Tax=Paraclostridium bifermentans TaxID=1490 RepID=UPI001897B614|nr:hypothetical protein [Paraclostridium bifermentans]